MCIAGTMSASVILFIMAMMTIVTEQYGPITGNNPASLVLSSTSLATAIASFFQVVLLVQIQQVTVEQQHLLSQHKSGILSLHDTFNNEELDGVSDVIQSIIDQLEEHDAPPTVFGFSVGAGFFLAVKGYMTTAALDIIGVIWSKYTP